MRPPQSPARAARTPLGWTLCAVCAASALAGCAGTETGNAADDGVPILFRFELTAEAPALTAPDADGRLFGVDVALGRVRRIDLSLPDGVTCADVAGRFAGGTCETDHIRYEGPWTVDLLTGEADPPIDGLRAPAGVYRRIDVRFAGDAAGPAIILEGDAPAGGAADRYDMRGDFTEDARFEGEAAVIAGEAAVDLDLVMPVDAWLAGTPLGACIDGGDVPIEDGVARIDEDLDGACEATIDALRRAMKRDGRLSRR